MEDTDSDLECGEGWLRAVVLEEDLRLDVPSVAPTVAAVLDMNIYDARQLVRYARGVVVECLPPPAADALVEAFLALGIRARAIPSTCLLRLGRPRRVTQVEFADTLLYRTSPQQEDWFRLPWESLVLLQVAFVARPHYRDFFSEDTFQFLPKIQEVEDVELQQELRTRLASRALRRETSEKIDYFQRDFGSEKDMQALYREQTDGYLDFHLRAETAASSEEDDFDAGPEVSRLRIDRRDFRFDCLREKLDTSSLVNFGKLSEEILRHAGDIHVPPITQAFRDGAEIHSIVFDSIEELDRYTRWHLWVRSETSQSSEGAAASDPCEETPDAG